MKTTAWIRMLLRRNPDLYRAIYDWNAYPHRWARAAWLDTVAVPAAIITPLEKSARGRRRLSSHYRKAFGLDAALWDFQEPRRRISLLTTPVLDRLALFVGAALLTPRLARIVTRTERQTITDSIGEDAYLFAMRRGRLLARSSALDGLIPGEGELTHVIHHAGWQSLAACLGGDDPALHLRFRLKAPKAIDLPSFSESSGITDGAWRLVQPIIKETLKTEDQRCFA